MKITEVDLFCPIFAVNWQYFEDNIASWIRELPIRKAFVGCPNPDLKEYQKIKECIEQYENFEFYDQRQYKTAGICFAELMKKVETEWFVYVHSDAFLTRFSFLVLKAEAELNRKVGIIESERIQYPYENPKPYPNLYPAYHYFPRAFSGYQLIRKKAIEKFINKIEDDYISNNEDIYFQNACENAGYRYIKSMAMHEHRTSSLNLIRTPTHQILPEKERRYLTYDMNLKALVKYCTPSQITLETWMNAFTTAYIENGFVLSYFIENFVRKYNPIWEKYIIDEITKRFMKK